MHLFCFGLGYSATNLADKLLEQGWRVSGTCRTTDKFPKLKTMGITPHIMSDGLPLENIWDLDSVTHILHSIPPSDGGDIVSNYHLQDLHKLPSLQWFGYLSTTGVYGDQDGGWVDESTHTKPYNPRSERRVEAEKIWLESELPVHIFRLAGIYGKGRSAIDALQKGTARRINKPGQLFSRIHVDDIAQIIQKSIENPAIGEMYNCADNMPASQSDVVGYAAELIGIDPPPLIDFENADLSPMAKSFYAANRKVKNDKIKTQLGVDLLYPDYKTGLKSCVL